MSSCLNTKNIVANFKNPEKKTINITQANSDFKYETMERMITDIH